MDADWKSPPPVSFFRRSTRVAPPENILFAGPGKSQAELELVIADGHRRNPCRIELEIERISAISRKLDLRTRVAVRVNPE